MNDFPSTPKDPSKPDENPIAKRFAEGYQPFSAKPVFSPETVEDDQSEIETSLQESAPDTTVALAAEKSGVPKNVRRRETRQNQAPVITGRVSSRRAKDFLLSSVSERRIPKKALIIGAFTLLLFVVAGLGFAAYSMIQNAPKPEVLKEYDLPAPDEQSYLTGVNSALEASGITLDDSLAVGKEVCTLLYNGKTSIEVEDRIVQEKNLDRNVVQNVMAHSVAFLCSDLGSVVRN